MEEYQRVTPYDEQTPKGDQIRRMFNSIAPTYDKLNRIISLGLDKRWRRRGIALLAPYQPRKILDIATGTGDLAIDLINKLPSVNEILGVDISEEMMRIAQAKVQTLGLDERISFAREDSTAMSFDNDSFDAVTIGFGIRNFEHIPQAAREIHRVLKSGKPLLILELTEPEALLPRLGYKLYAGHIIPWLGRIVSGDADSYTYLPRSIVATPQRQAMVDLLLEAGFSEAYHRVLFPGTCAIYVAVK